MTALLSHLWSCDFSQPKNLDHVFVTWQFIATQIHNLNISCKEKTCNTLTQSIGVTVNGSLLVCAIQLAFWDSCVMLPQCLIPHRLSLLLLMVSSKLGRPPREKEDKNLQISPCFMKMHQAYLTTLWTNALGQRHNNRILFVFLLLFCDTRFHAQSNYYSCWNYS